MGHGERCPVEVEVVKRSDAARCEPLSNTELVAGLEAGDDGAFVSLYRQYGRMVHRVAWHRLRRADLADDATQETMLRVWGAASRLDPARPIAPWLTTVAKRVAIDIGRREAVRATVPLRDADARALAVADSTSRSDIAAVVHAAVARLESDDADLVRLHHFDGLSYTEVSERMGTPVGTIKSRSSRVHRQLALLLQDAGA
jgi:RNA polymerase sigma-70 factor, ECF subfamily